MFFRHFSSVLLLSAVALCAPPLLPAQSSGNLIGSPSSSGNQVPKIELFGGYSRYHAGGTVDGVTVPNLTNGWAGQLIIEASNRVGVVVDISNDSNKTDSALSFAVGPQFRFHMRGFMPFVEGLVGIQSFSPKQFPNQKAATYLIGSGVDLAASRRLSIRPVQVDFVNTYYSAISPTGKTNPFYGYRLRTGVVFNLTLPSPEGEVSAACSAEPAKVDPGAAVTINVTPKGFLPKRILRFNYDSVGAKVAGSTATASVDTTGTEPGSYTVTAKVLDNGKGKHQQTASCTATFAVNARSAPTKSASADGTGVSEKHPPTLSVSAVPDSLKSGDSSTITANGSTADSRPLTYNCTATAGKLTGNGPTTFTLDTAGVGDNTITVNCTVSDDRNLTASTSASVKVALPLHAKKFGSIEFRHDVKRPTRVDNVAKAELDRYADALAATLDAEGLVVGYATSTEDRVAKQGKYPNFAAQRAVNTKDYLSRDKGIDPARIEPRAGHGRSTAVLWIVPAGAPLPEASTTKVDEARLKAVPRTPLKSKKAAHKTRTKLGKRSGTARKKSRRTQLTRGTS